jgi:hypothetical protein
MDLLATMEMRKTAARARAATLSSLLRELCEREREREKSKQAGGQEGLGRPGQEKRAEEEMRS